VESIGADGTWGRVTGMSPTDRIPTGKREGGRWGTPPADSRPRWLSLSLLVLVLYVFLMSIDLISGSFKLMGKDLATQLFAYTHNPFSGLLTGLLATSMVQSSSTVTSLIVGLVAGGTVTIEQAVPMVMGANIGTSITNTIVAMGHMTRSNEFERAFAGATVHDFFNLLAVTVFLPLEIWTGFLHRLALQLERLLVGAEVAEFHSPLKAAIKPASKFIQGVVTDVVTAKVVASVILLVLGLAVLILSLSFLVRLMRRLMMGQVEVMLHNYLFKHAIRGILVGTVITILVQSSSVTTSLTVPLLAAGIVSVEAIFPFILGANVGTTITALLASMATGNASALTVALCHVLFNVFGIVLLYPLRGIPIWLALTLGRLTLKSRVWAFAYILGAFFVLPFLLILAAH
jgi:sodium-dependent phosphate cotransporter